MGRDGEIAGVPRLRGFGFASRDEAAQARHSGKTSDPVQALRALTHTPPCLSVLRVASKSLRSAPRLLAKAGHIGGRTEIGLKQDSE